MLGGSGTCSRKIFEMIDAIWCVLMYYFDQITSEKSTIIIIKIIIIATHLTTFLLWVILLPERLKKHALVDAFLSYLA